MGSLDSFFEVEDGKKKQKILMIDFHNLVYRMIFVAGAEFKNKKSEFIMGSGEEFTKNDMYSHWKWMVLNSLLYGIKDYEANKVVVALESKNNWRKDIFSEYKAHRKAAREDSIIDFDEFFPILEEFTTTLKSLFTNMYFMQVSRCEGDDIVAVVAKKYANNNDYELRLISSDKDFVQLQESSNFSQFTPIKRELLVSSNPKKDLMIKILSGDSSDGIPNVKNKFLPNVKRCGPKTAEKMINNGLVDIEENEEFKSNFTRNKMIIDFSNIPDFYQETILNEYDNYDIKPIDGAYVWNWLGDNNFPTIYENWQMFFKYVKDLS